MRTSVHAHSAGHPWPAGDPLTQAASNPGSRESRRETGLSLRIPCSTEKPEAFRVSAGVNLAAAGCELGTGHGPAPCGDDVAQRRIHPQTDRSPEKTS